MIVITIDEEKAPDAGDVMFGNDAVLVKYRPVGAKVFQRRGCGDDPTSTLRILERLVQEVMRQAFPTSDASKEAAG